MDNHAPQALPTDATNGLPALPDAHPVSSPTLTTCIDDKVLTRLMEAMLGMYGSRFTDAWVGTDQQIMRRVWGSQLKGFSIDEISQGIEGCKKLKFPPTLPEFLMFCRPPIDAEAAYYEAVTQLRNRASGKDEWTSAAVFHAAASLAYELRTTPYQAVKSRWIQALEVAAKAVRDQKLPATVPAAPLALLKPAAGCTPSPETKKRIDAILGRLPTRMTGAQS